MAITPAGSPQTFVESVSNTSTTQNVAVQAGSDRVLVVFTKGERSGSASPPAISSVTYNGVALSSIGSASIVEGTNSVGVFAHILLEANFPSGSPDINTLSVSLSTGFAPGGGLSGFGVTVRQYNDVAQSVPTNKIEISDDAAVSVIAGSLDTTETDSYIVASAVNNNEARIWDDFNGTTPLVDFDTQNSRGAVSEELRPTTGSPDSVSFSASSGTWGRAALIAFELEPAAGVGTKTRTASLQAALVAQQSLSSSLAAVLKGTKTLTPSLDGVIGEVGTSPGRGLSSINETATLERIVRPVIFFELEINDGSPSEFVRLTNAPYDITWGGNVFSGVGNLGTVSATEETTELKAPGIEVTLNGLDPSFAAIALGRHIQGDPVTIYLGFFDEGHGLIDTPFILFRGRADTMPIKLGQTASIRLTIESVLADWDRPRVRRYNNADQQERFEGDKFFEFAEQTVDKEIIWPARTFFDR